MKKIIALASAVILISGCNRKFNSDTVNGNSTDITPTPAKINVTLKRMASPATANFTSIVVDVVCPKALPGGNDWSEKDVNINASSSTFQIVSGFACNVSLKSYKDTSGIIYTVKSSPLVINIDASGLAPITEAISYIKTLPDNSVDPSPWYFAAASPTPFGIILNYGTDPTSVTNALANSNTSMIPTNVIQAGPGAAAPIATPFNLEKTQRNDGKADYSLLGTVSGAKKCQIFPAASVPDFSYNTVNNLMNASTGTDCPANMLSGNQGNWNSFNNAGNQVIIWGNKEDDKEYLGYIYLTILAQTPLAP
ncbi:hypothetical protein [Silvanigrella aquatica]|uniref:Uncharacterized protein n=1 Tax=Silvanigrella aquatica TaxID=1915309 RepID=A0A1L4CZV1_9BACT|nr:hypothetical protein [Silvanigrella aquatica]APJ03457.1 hypothetical protein AXG55_05880 [Silvanigrella aquatica]